MHTQSLLAAPSGYDIGRFTMYASNRRQTGVSVVPMRQMRSTIHCAVLCQTKSTCNVFSAKTDGNDLYCEWYEELSDDLMVTQMGWNTYLYLD